MKRFIKQSRRPGDLKKCFIPVGLLVLVLASSCHHRSVEPPEVVHASATPARVEASGGDFIVKSSSVTSQTKLLHVGRLPEGRGEGRTDLQCLKEGLCWLSDSKTIWRTENSGLTWERIDDEGSTFSDRSGVIFLSKDVGWGWNSRGVYKTENGGKRWEEQPPLMSRGREVFVRTIRFEDGGQIGWLAGSSYQPIEKGEGTTRYTRGRTENEIIRPAVFWTRNGGRQWNESLVAEKVGWVDQIQFYDSHDGFARGHMCQMYSQDGGKTWRQIDAAPECWDETHETQAYWEARAVKFFILDRSHGWLVYNDGRIEVSRNGGKKWCELFPPSKDPVPMWISDIYFIDALRGWGVGKAQLHETSDGGRTWKKIEYPASFHQLVEGAGKEIWLKAEEGIFKILTE